MRGINALAAEPCAIALGDMPGASKRLRDNIKIWMTERHMNQTQLAIKAGVSQSFISQILNGQRDLPTKTVQAIANALRIPAERLWAPKGGLRRLLDDPAPEVDPELVDRYGVLSPDGRERLLEQARFLAESDRYIKPQQHSELDREARPATRAPSAAHGPGFSGASNDGVRTAKNRRPQAGRQVVEGCERLSLAHRIGETHMLRLIAVVVFSVMAASCSKDASPTSPSTPTPPTQTIVALTGTVSASSGARLANATVTVLDGINIGRATTTNGNGDYRLETLTIGNANLSAIADGYQAATRGVYINGANTLSFTLSPAPLPVFTMSGTGATVFDMPRHITRVRIQGLYSGRCENFIVHIAGRGVVNVILGSCSVADSQNYDGTHLIAGGGVVETLHSNGVNWIFTEVR